MPSRLLPTPVLRTERLLLRPAREGDLDALFAIFSDPQTTRYWWHLAMTDPEQARFLLRAPEDRGDFIRWVLVLPQEDRPLGTCTIFRLDLQNQKAEIGYALSREQWRKGFMAEALTEIIRYAFESLELRRLEADIDPRNAASCRLVERLGFQREGLLRERWCVAGEITDTAFYGLLQKEWERVRNRDRR